MSNNANATLQNAKHILTLAGQKGLTGEGCNLLVRTGFLADLYEAAGEVDLLTVNRDEFRKFIGLPPLELWITVNYNLSLSEMIAAGGYDWFNGLLFKPEQFPLKGVGEKRWKAELIHLNRDMSSEDVLAKLDTMGFRPGAIEELLAFGATFPGIQRKFPIAALGSITTLSGRRYAAYIGRDGMSRTLNRLDLADEWGSVCRFLAFR